MSVSLSTRSAEHDAELPRGDQIRRSGILSAAHDVFEAKVDSRFDESLDYAAFLELVAEILKDEADRARTADASYGPGGT